MITNNSHIEIYINGEQLELKDQESLGLRINRTIFNPEENATTQAEWSYSFQIPSTPNNDKVFSYASVFSKRNKFHQRYDCEVVADGTSLFKGSLVIQGYDAKEQMYECNLVSIKFNTLDDIFGEDTLDKIPWFIDYDGAPTINSVNNDSESKYFFPLVCYGMFAKTPVTKDEVGGTYTSKYIMDKYNKWWHETFQPSVNTMEHLKKAFEWKGYTVDGSAFHDHFINKIYESENISKEQIPIYNLGNPKFGKVRATGSNINTRNVTYVTHQLDFPYFYLQSNQGSWGRGTSYVEEQYNWESVKVFNLLGNNTSIQSPTYMYQPEEGCIVIPADGFYHIKLTATADLQDSNGDITPLYYITQTDNTIAEETRTVPKGYDWHTPIEIQLVRNANDDYELIKGKNNITWRNGDPTRLAWGSAGQANMERWETCFPHENPMNAKLPTAKNGMNQRGGADSVTTPSRFGGARNSTANTSTNTSNSNWDWTDMGYMPDPNAPDVTIFAYDPYVSQNFICGFSSFREGTVAVMKNGSSWSKNIGDKNETFYNQQTGYSLLNRVNTTNTYTPTKYNSNTYPYGAKSLTSSRSTLNGTIECAMRLNKDDIIQLVALHRAFRNSATYDSTISFDLTIEAISEKRYDKLKSEGFDANWTTEFPYQLNLSNFANNETKITDYIDNVCKAFNLSINQDGNNISIDTNKGIYKEIQSYINLDDRVGHNEYESSMIEYPRSMSVRWKVDKEEMGFEMSVSDDHINDDDWDQWGESGYTIIDLSDDTYNTDTQDTSINFSYTWYAPFTFKQVTKDNVETGSETLLSIPIIETSEFMADGFNYEDAMKHDGYSLTQRFWFRGTPTTNSVFLDDALQEEVYITTPVDNYDRIYLDYKNEHMSILTEYFNVYPRLSSNYITISPYIKVQEYKDIVSGTKVIYNDDVHIVCEVSGFDPSGNNPTELKLMQV